MANLTITVDEQTLKRARIRALEEGGSVNRFLARQLARYARGDLAEEARESAERLVALSEKIAGSSGGQGWTREELWEDAL